MKVNINTKAVPNYISVPFLIIVVSLVVTLLALIATDALKQYSCLS